MDSTITFKTHNGSYYLYDIMHSVLLNSHPILESIDYYIKQGQQSKMEKLLIEDYPTYSIDEIRYYIKKYSFLKESGLFTELNTDNLLSSLISPETIRKNIANLDNILFQVTGNCNLSCKYCCYGDMYIDNTTQSNMTKDMVDKVFNYMLPKWESSVNLSYRNPIIIGFYGGEPLLNFPIVEYIVSCCKKMESQKLKFIYSMTTNGILLDRHMSFLADNDVSLLISLDGNKTHSQLRVDKNGKESFERNFNNVRLLQTKYPEYFDRKVKFNSVLNKYSNATDVHRFILNEFGKSPMMESISQHMLDDEKHKEYRDLYQPYHETEELMRERGMQSPLFKGLSMFFYYQLNNSYKNYVDLIYGKSKLQKKIPTGTCLPFHKKMFVTADGDLLACERIGLQYVLGTITDQVNIDFDKVAEIYTHYFTNILKYCEECYSVSSCSRCLFQLPLKEKAHVCPYKHDKKIYQNYLSNLFGKLESMPELFTKVNKMISA